MNAYESANNSHSRTFRSQNAVLASEAQTRKMLEVGKKLSAETHVLLGSCWHTVAHLLFICYRHILSSESFGMESHL